MEFHVGEFILLENGLMLETVYADDEKAVCLILETNLEGEWEYVNKCIAISNKAEQYKGVLLGWKKVPAVMAKGIFQWKPLLPVLKFPSYLFT